MNTDTIVVSSSLGVPVAAVIFACFGRVASSKVSYLFVGPVLWALGGCMGL